MNGKRRRRRATEPGHVTFDFPTITLDVKSGDVVRPYAAGLAGDTTIYATTEIWEYGYLRPYVGGQYYADVDTTGRFKEQPSQFYIKKNSVLSGLTFLMLASSDHVSVITGLTVGAQRSIDGGAFAPCTNAAGEVSNGIYKITLTSADLNGSVVTLMFTATGADNRYMTLVTQA
jgi:hypothetical protein